MTETGQQGEAKYLRTQEVCSGNLYYVEWPLPNDRKDKFNTYIYINGMKHVCNTLTKTGVNF